MVCLGNICLNTLHKGDDDYDDDDDDDDDNNNSIEFVFLTCRLYSEGPNAKPARIRKYTDS